MYKFNVITVAFQVGAIHVAIKVAGVRSGTKVGLCPYPAPA